MLKRHVLDEKSGTQSDWREKTRIFDVIKFPTYIARLAGSHYH